MKTSLLFAYLENQIGNLPCSLNGKRKLETTALLQRKWNLVQLSGLGCRAMEGQTQVEGGRLGFI